MKYLVTGGAGFIGHHLVLRLRAEGHEVTIVDCFNDYYDPKLKEKRLERFDETVTVVRADITDIVAMEEVFAAGSFDGVCHLAAQAGVRYSLEHPDVYVQSNYVGTFNILELSKRHKVQHVVCASTSSVYGTSTDMPFTEDNPVTTPMSIYAATKRGTELLGANYNHLFDLNVTFLRFFTVYGPWGRPDMALFIFTRKILASEPIDVYNNGNMRRDFTYIDDIVDGFYRALQTPSGFNILNLGNGSPVGLMDYISTLETELGKKAEISFKPIQPGDVPETYADISKAQKQIGYQPQTNIDVGIKKFVEWYRSYYDVA